MVIFYEQIKGLKMSIDQFISLAASIAACLTAIASFIAIIQNSKQRRESYKPQLVIKNILFEATSNGVANHIPDKWESKEFTSQKNFFSLPLVNIGLGTARQIQAEWFFDFDSYIQKINKSAQKAFIPAYLEYKKEQEQLHIKIQQKTSSLNRWNIQKKQQIDFVLPISLTVKETDLRIPHAIIDVISTDSFLFMDKNDEKNYSPSEIPTIELQLSYLDLGNKMRKEQYEIKISISSWEKKEDSSCSFHGYIECKKKPKEMFLSASPT